MYCAHGGEVDRHDQQKLQCLWHSWALSNDSMHNETIFSKISQSSTDLLIILELYRAHTPRAAASMWDSLPAVCWRPLLNINCARLCAWTESTWWVELMGVANKMQYLRRSWTLPNDSKHNEASFSTISTDMLYLRVTQTPRSPDLAIFVLTTTDDRKTDYFTPCACAWDNYIIL